MRHLLTTLAIIAAGPSLADCLPPSEPFLSCTLSEGRKALDVCYDTTTVT